MPQLIALLFISVVLPGKPVACSCPPSLPVLEEYARSSNVFLAEAVSVEDASTTARVTWWAKDKIAEVTPLDRPGYDLRGMGKRVHFKVIESYKNPMPEDVFLVTGQGGGDCGFPVEVGKTYLIYQRQPSEHQVDFSICSRCAEVGKAGTDLAALRSLGPPKPLEAQKWFRARRWFREVMLAIVLSFVGVAAYLFWKRKARSHT